MMGIVAQKDVASGCHTDNVNKYLVLVVLKMGLDAAVLYMCYRKRYTSFLSMCSLSMVLADFVMVLSFSSVLFLGRDRYLMSLCFVLAHASATYEALPLPMMCLVLLDYCLEGTCLGKQSTYSKILRHTALALLVWILVIFSNGSVKSDLIQMDFPGGISALVCDVQESTQISYFTLGLFFAVICAMLPFWSMIPQWVREADRLSVAREKRENQSDLWSTPTNCNCVETKGIEEKSLEETIYPCPPLWFSIILGFSLFWMPYLTVSVVGILLDFGVPAYITVNLLWLECTNSLLMGAVFWANSNTEGPYRLPENVCDWPIYWHLSKGTQQQPFPPTVFNPPYEKRHTLLCV